MGNIKAALLHELENRRRNLLDEEEPIRDALQGIDIIQDKVENGNLPTKLIEDLYRVSITDRYWPEYPISVAKG